MKRSIRPASWALLALLVVAFLVIMAAAAGKAQATEGHTPGPSFATCKNLDGWYANPDEQAYLPEPTVTGLKFEGKDLIHRQTSPIDLADMDKVVYGFDATTAGKVVFKVETTAPYSTIVTNADGKIWSTAMTYDQEGGQGHPVAKYSELVGKPTKPGKAPYTSASAATTFGVGYWVEDGSTVVSEIRFHGHTFDLTCPPVTTSPSASASTSTSASASASTSTSASASASTSTSATTRPSGNSSAAPGGAVTTTDVASTGGLPVTGPSIGLFIAMGLLVTGGGVLLFLASRKRKMSFEG